MPAAAQKSQKKKLSAAQVRALRWLDCHDMAAPSKHYRYSDYERLMRLGYASKQPSGRTVFYRITEAGRRALAALAESEASEDKS